jgi:hypothetical protein
MEEAARDRLVAGARDEVDELIVRGQVEAQVLDRRPGLRRDEPS